MTGQNEHKSSPALEALERVLKSDDFSSAPKMRHLLRFIVSETIEGRAKTIKGYTIGIEVFGREESFDPETDSIVRVQMGRLRKYLDHYYLTMGKEDPVRITVPKGTYVPQFDQQQISTQTPTETESTGLSLGKLLSSALVLSVIVALSTYYFIIRKDTHEVIAAPQKAKIKDLFDGPTIAVFPFRDLSPVKDNNYLQKGLAIDLVSNLSRFKNLFILSPDTTIYSPLLKKTPLGVGQNFGVQHIVTGSYTMDSNMLRVTAQMQETQSRRVIWSGTYKRHVKAESIFAIQARISRAIASTLGQPYGIINRRENNRIINRQKGSGSQQNNPISLSAYKCVLDFYEYAHEENPANHLHVRKCLELAIEQQPDYAQAYAALSWIYVDEYRQGFNPRINSNPPLDRALEIAHQAVTIDPDDAFTHRRLANVYIVRGDMRLAHKEILKAYKLNPNSSEVLADMGWIVKNTGDWFTAFSFASKAIALNPGHPPWYLETPFLYHYANQDCTNAYSTARSYQRQESRNLLSQVFLIVSAALCRNRPDVAISIRDLNRSFPDFLTSPGKSLTDRSIPDTLIPLMLDALLESGVELGRR